MRAFRPTKRQSNRFESQIRAEKAKKALPKRLPGFLPLLALMALIGLHRIADTSPMSWSLQGQAFTLTASNTGDVMVHRADWIGDIIDAIDEILDILEGNGDGEGGGGEGGGEGGGGEGGGD